MNKPKIAIAVYVENGGWGADFGVPIGSLMMEQYINGHLSPSSERQAAAMQARRIGYGPRFPGQEKEKKAKMAAKTRKQKQKASAEGQNAEAAKESAAKPAEAKTSE